jgi:dTDP-4-dehydrorhamnose reductase
VTAANSTERGGGTAVTGSAGRLGRALLASAPGVVYGWERPSLDLDQPDSLVALVEQDRPSLVIHAAAMTQVDEAARQPAVAQRRNAEAVAALATACRAHGAGLLLVSTNEVFDGERTDGRGYTETDTVGPRNPYGASKLAGEEAARAAFDGAEGLWIVRTAWLYGPPGADFPDKITAAADRLGAEPLPVVADEIGSPTYTLDLARAIHALLERTSGGLFHLANDGATSRYEWAQAVLAVRRPGRQLTAISRTQFERASDPPPWGVLDSGRAEAAGVVMRPWRTALAEYLAITPAG